MTDRDARAAVLRDKVAVVTGGGRGIGAATAAALAAAGARVAVLARSTDQLETVVREIRARQGVAAAITCDVADPSRATSSPHRRAGV